jgi:hypothetical protein
VNKGEAVVQTRGLLLALPSCASSTDDGWNREFLPSLDFLLGLLSLMIVQSDDLERNFNLRMVKAGN